MSSAGPRNEIDRIVKVGRLILQDFLEVSGAAPKEDKGDPPGKASDKE